ncbi:DUF2239 family protein [Chelativorans sp.]|uniref:DUF2239 family protein n=1 Tax=Chelativorans sp. TaxID=2203393 RepID=UPI0028123E95|nr:DUF2239 family protein [Chelativorans sp.]
MTDAQTCTAFEGHRRVASGSRLEVALHLKRDGRDNVLVFDDSTGRQIDFDLSGTPEQIARRLVITVSPRPLGRPKLGVVAREVTLLPRHWEWLNRQPGGASATLRRLVDAARKADDPTDRIRNAQEAADRFMMAMLGDHPGYEEAARALYAADKERFLHCIAEWPKDLKAYVERLAAPAFTKA